MSPNLKKYFALGFSFSMLLLLVGVSQIDWDTYDLGIANPKMLENAVVDREIQLRVAIENKTDKKIRLVGAEWG